MWRLFQALDQRGTEQIASYDDGVGTSGNKYLAALGGAFGWGLKRNVAAVVFLAALVLVVASVSAEWEVLTRIELTSVAILAGLFLLWRCTSASRVHAASSATAQSGNLPASFALKLARKLRTNRTLATLVSLATNIVIPIAFALGLVAAGAMLANRILFDVALAAGHLCTGKTPSDASAQTDVGTVGGFDTRNNRGGGTLTVERTAAERTVAPAKPE